MELRTATRCRLKFPVRFRWQDREKRRWHGTGFTRDISSAGLFIVTSACPPAGVTLQFDVLLPPLEATAPKIQMQGVGRVLRVEPAGAALGVWGFAAANESFSLLELEKSSKSRPSEEPGSISACRTG
jgi:hypothetical protein